MRCRWPAAWATTYVSRACVARERVKHLKPAPPLKVEGPFKKACCACRAEPLGQWNGNTAVFSPNRWRTKLGGPDLYLQKPKPWGEARANRFHPS